MRQLSFTPELKHLLSEAPVIAFGISGGKDSAVMAMEVNKWLDDNGHPREKRCCIHSDLGVIEWPQTMEWVRKTAARVELPLFIVSRRSGDMLDRWEQRWSDNMERYRNLQILSVITPWSSAQWRFCTSELKVSPITSKLKKLFPGETILNLTGIRKQESTGRAKAPVLKANRGLVVKTKGTQGYSWNPILDYTLEDVYAVHHEQNFPLHPAYTDFGSSRLSCSLCVLAKTSDHLAALKMRENHEAYRRITKLETESTFSFQPNRWVSERRLDLLPLLGEATLEQAKARGARRVEIETEIPESLRFVKGVPERIPTTEEAKVLTDIRKEMQDILFMDFLYTKPQDLVARYRELAQPAWDAVMARGK